MIRRGAKLEEAGWDEAFTRVREILEAAGDKAAGFGSPHATNEENFLLASLIEAAGSGLLGLGTSWEQKGEDDEILKRADLSPNRAGGTRILGEAGLEQVLADAKALVILGGNPLQGAPAAIATALRKLDDIVVLATHLDDTSKEASVVLPIAAFAERGGTVTNFQGQTQVVGAAVPPPGEARPAVEVLADLAEALGAKKVKRDPAALFDEIAKKVKPFKGLKFTKLGDLGAGGTKEEGQ
jgi:predicted molibdopterin-dependent oxidoreductase YjgC